MSQFDNRHTGHCFDCTKPFRIPLLVATNPAKDILRKNFKRFTGTDISELLPPAHPDVSMLEIVPRMLIVVVHSVLIWMEHRQPKLQL